MPNWKKVIVSGSDAHLSSLSATSITGSLLGTASYALNTGEVFGYQHTQSSAANSWTINHNLSTFTPVVQVFDTNYKQILPKEIQSTTVNRTVVTFDYNQAGYAIVSKGLGLTDINTDSTGNTLVQGFTGSIWTINHNFNTLYPIVQVYSGSSIMIPDSVVSTNENTTTIVFSGSVQGTVIVSTGVGSEQTSQLAQTASYSQTAEKVVSIATTPPSSQSTGSLWWNNNDGNLYVQTNNPSGSIWVPATSNIIGNADTASYAETASYVVTAKTASYVIGGAIPNWTTVGTIQSVGIGATTTSPTFPTSPLTNVLMYKQIGPKTHRVRGILLMGASTTGATGGSGDYLFTLPYGLQFDSTNPDQTFYTGSVQTSHWDIQTRAIMGGTTFFTHNNYSAAVQGGVGGIIPWDATRYRISAPIIGSGIRAWSSNWFQMGYAYSQYKWDFEFQSL
jgi:hypothetical protein